MQVRFEIDDFGDEAAALQAVSDGRAPEEADHLWGRIVLEHAGQPTVAIEDDLTMLGLALCVDVPAALLREGRADLRLVGWPGEYAFVADAGHVHLTGSLDTDATLPQTELQQQLGACGKRLAAFINKLAATCPQYAFSGQALAANLAKA
nr:hypothetical protein [uncultured Roseateles sp.]